MNLEEVAIELRKWRSFDDGQVHTMSPYSDAKQRRSRKYIELHQKLKREVAPAIGTLEGLDKRARKMLRSAEFRAGRS